MYEPRIYRQLISVEDLVTFQVQEKESDLLICASKNFDTEALASIQFYRAQIEQFIARYPIFLTSYVPVEIPGDACEIIKSMSKESRVVQVGPMATVAGAISEFVGKDLLKLANEVIIENGGDIFMKTSQPRKIGIFAGESILSNKLAIIIKPEQTPIGVCTSSGTVGHSKSFGKADAVVILAKSCILADAVATRVGNMIRNKKDIQTALDYSRTLEGVLGAAVILEDSLGGWGSFEFTSFN